MGVRRVLSWFYHTDSCFFLWGMEMTYMTGDLPDTNQIIPNQLIMITFFLMFIAISFIYKIYLFYTVVWLIYNVVLISGVEWSDSVIYELNFFQIFSPYMIKITFQQNIETAIKSWFVVARPIWGLFFLFLKTGANYQQRCEDSNRQCMWSIFFCFLVCVEMIDNIMKYSLGGCKHQCRLTWLCMHAYKVASIVFDSFWPYGL